VSLSFGRVLKATEADRAAPLRGPPPHPLPLGRRVPRVEVDALERARHLLAESERRAAQITERAERQAAALRLEAEARARAEAAATIAGQALALAEQRARSEERQTDRIVEIARLLAERLLGEVLELSPERVASLARQAIAQVRGAAHVTLLAHPEDVPHLQAAVQTWDLELRTLRVVPDPSAARGNLRLETEIGTLEAALGPQLDRLAAKVREELGHAR